MLKRELLERLVIKEIEHKVESAGIKVDVTMKSVIEYLYDHQNRNGFIYMSIRDMILECDLYHLGEEKDEILNNAKDILFELENVILSEYSAEQIEPIKDLDELLILEFIETLI